MTIFGGEFIVFLQKYERFFFGINFCHSLDLQIIGESLLNGFAVNCEFF